MAKETNIATALEAFRRAVGGLENAIDRRFEEDHDFAAAKAEVQRMNTNRSRLAQELDRAEDRANRLEEANREVSRRLVTSMETIRAVLDR